VAVTIIVYDATNRDCYRSVAYWMRELKANVGEAIGTVVCINKMDREAERLIDHAGVRDGGRAGRA
jgi:GTPase SAR1 family protein